MATVTADEMRRLAFIKYLYGVAVEQSQRPEPTKAAALLTFHDAVELFLYLATQHLGVAEKKLEFAGYFTVLKKALPGGRMPREGKMLSLNDERTGLKHYGNPPSSALIGEFRNDVETFFEENTPLVFDGLEFDNISMVHLVQCAEARTSLEDAQRQMSAGDTKEAIERIAVAFDQLLKKYEYPDLPDGDSPYRDLFGPPLYGEPISDKVQSVLHQVGSAVYILGFGLDFRRYVKFRMLIPSVFQSPETYLFVHKGGEIPSLKNCRFCFDFVIESALHLQEFDFDVK